MSTTNAICLSKVHFIVVVILLWFFMLYGADQPLPTVFDYWLFSLLGLIGAIFANSTGAGGGVVFIPMFEQLNFSAHQAIASSFAIQCFGMTAGAVTWYLHYYRQQKALPIWSGFKRIISTTAVAAILTITGVFTWEISSPASLHTSFSWFSLLLGIAIILTVYLLKPHREPSQLYRFDYVALVLIGLFGGAITAWLSVGVGELLVIYLILRRFDINMAVAAAVVVSALTVWAAIWHIKDDVYWQVVFFAGPGAVLGGIFAKKLVTYLSATKLKLFFAMWLLVTGCLGFI